MTVVEISVQACKMVCDVLRTSLGPRGMDKLIFEQEKNHTLISNDGATIMKEIKIQHPAARMLVDLSHAQDVAAGDGTTTVVLIAGTLLDAALTLINKGVHASQVAKSFMLASHKAAEILREMAQPVDTKNTFSMVTAAKTSLNSKVVSNDSGTLAQIAVDACAAVAQPGVPDIDMSRIKVVQKLGGSVEDCELIHGLVFANTNALRGAGGPVSVSNAKIGLIQFHIGPPKTDIEQNVVIKNYEAMDRLLREERVITAKQVKAIAATGCNVLLVQKSIMRTAISELACDYLAKAKIMLIRDIEREDMDFISRTLACQPVASLDEFTAAALGNAALVVDEPVQAGGRLTKITGVSGTATTTILCRGSNELILDETHRSLTDALLVVRSLYKQPFLLPGGGAPEMQLSYKLQDWAKTFQGVDQVCIKEYGEALELLPYTLAENSGLDAIEVVTKLRNCHSKGLVNYGIDIKKGEAGDLVGLQVVQPLLVTWSAIRLATETVMAILKIDDILMSK